MRVAFISFNRERLPDAVVPLGLLYVMASLPARHERILVDLCFEADPAATIRERLTAFAPDVVAVGIRNVQSSDYGGMQENLRAYRAAVDAIRSATRAPIVLGGAGVSVIPHIILQELQADYAIAGEGETAFGAFVDALEAADSASPSVDHIPRLYHRQDTHVERTEAAVTFQDLDALPRPDRSLLDPRYYAEFGIDSVQTKRGCGLRCTYCTYPRIEGAAVRTRDPVAVVDELFAIVEQSPEVSHVFIVDSVFNLPRRHAKAVCREMIARRFSIPWTCYANPLGFDRELAELMVEAGCAGVEIGSDSGCDHVLEALLKGFSTEDIRGIHRLCKETGLRDCHTFIVGTMGETMEDVETTLDFIVDLDPFAAIIMSWVDDEEAGSPELHAQRQAFRAQIEARLDQRRRAHPRWIIPTTAVNFGERLFRVLRRQGLTGPLWQHLDLIGPAPA